VIVVTTVDLIGQLADHGILGLLLAICLLAYWWKDRQLTREKDARIADARVLTDLALKFQQQSIEHVQKIHDVFEELKRTRGLR
jgi:hypothetical protein